MDKYEDNGHLFGCTNPSMQKIQMHTSYYLQKSLHDYGNSELSNLLEIGIQQGINTKSWTPARKDVSKEWRQGIKDQSIIGWRHIINGRIAKSLITAMQYHYTSLNINKLKYTGEHWAKLLIKNIWQTMLQLWQTRNEIIYQEDSIKAREQQIDKLRTRVERCYELKHKLKANE
jgi:hypothetical protein